MRGWSEGWGWVGKPHPLPQLDSGDRDREKVSNRHFLCACEVSIVKVIMEYLLC